MENKYNAGDIMWWEPYLLDLSKGFLISGLFLFVISVIFGAMHGFGHDHDLSGDHDINIDGDYDASIDHDVDVDHDWDHSSVQGESSDTGTPLMLLAASFMLSFGFFGTTLYEIAMNPYLRLLTIFPALSLPRGRYHTKLYWAPVLIPLAVADRSG